MKAERMADL